MVEKEQKVINICYAQRPKMASSPVTNLKKNIQFAKDSQGKITIGYLNLKQK